MEWYNFYEFLWFFYSYPSLSSEWHIRSIPIPLSSQQWCKLKQWRMTKLKSSSELHTRVGIWTWISLTIVWYSNHHYSTLHWFLDTANRRKGDIIPNSELKSIGKDSNMKHRIPPVCGTLQWVRLRLSWMYRILPWIRSLDDLWTYMKNFFSLSMLVCFKHFPLFHLGEKGAMGTAGPKGMLVHHDLIIIWI